MFVYLFKVHFFFGKILCFLRIRDIPIWEYNLQTPKPHEYNYSGDLHYSESSIGLVGLGLVWFWFGFMAYQPESVI